MNPLLNFFLLIIIASLAIPSLSIAPFAPTRKKDLKRIHTIMNLKKGQKVLEIGFGDARVSSYLAKNNKESDFIGIELSPILFIIAKINLFFSHTKNLKLKLKNAFKEDFKSYDYIYIFGMPDVLKNKLKEKFIKEMKPGAKIISYSFDIEGWPGKKIKDKPSPEFLSIYIMTKE
ncbi:class I SAM-dependent methyltransferase [Candidatus Gracilibacteria bacterium]|nr:class I SAM-dependent methyltransferase [Candidatus Gracilibacteria bacterium]NUJ98574.1 class I SAM-dependent methyltransferase [Candidatus Gracilibacteria bacterium]